MHGLGINIGGLDVGGNRGLPRDSLLSSAGHWTPRTGSWLCNPFDNPRYLSLSQPHYPFEEVQCCFLGEQADSQKSYHVRRRGLPLVKEVQGGLEYERMVGELIRKGHIPFQSHQLLGNHLTITKSYRYSGSFLG